MRRALVMTWLDMRVQLRAGFVYATLAVIGLWALGRWGVPALAQPWILPALMLNALAITSFYFAAGLSLLERAHGTRVALWVTPLRAAEYLCARLLTLGALALLQALVAGLLFAGPRFAALPLLLGAALASVILTLAGAVAAAPHDSISSFLLPSAPLIGALLLPLVTYALDYDAWPIYLHPLQPALVLMRAASAPTEPWLLAYAALYGGAWAAALFWLARRAHSREGV
jgi:fluoroquinolone transport system permease protein